MIVMDPISILGSAIGITSLLIQVADECIKGGNVMNRRNMWLMNLGYHFYCKVVAMPTEYQHLTIRIQMEQRRFLTFSQEAGLLWVEQRICDTLQINQSLLLAILAEIKLLFEQTNKQLAKYIKHMPKDATRLQGEPVVDLVDKLCLPDLQLSSSSNELSSPQAKGFRHLRRWCDNAVTTGKNLRDIALDPRRLTFTFVDQSVIERLITRLAELNSFLIVLLDESQTERLRVVVNNSYREILQVREDVQTLQRLLEALNTGGPQTNPSRIDDDETLNSAGWTSMVQKETELQIRQRDYLKKLTEIKLQYKIALSTIDVKPILNIQPMNLKLFKSIKELSSGRSSAIYDKQAVWIEWKDADTMTAGDIRPAEDLMRLLADLMCNQKPERFRSPPCLGYARRESATGETQFGMAFRDPRDQPNTKLITLKALLDGPMPSLSERMKLCEALAECLFEFHTVGWLHKGFRSDNVVFFAEESHEVDFASPYMLGFQLSRPDMLDEMTIKPKFIAAEEIYRHPRAQFSSRGSRYRKSYDLYSLAIVLIEIAVWKPIQAVVGIESMTAVRPRILQEIKERLVKEGRHLQSVACAAGGLFKKVVASCLLADDMEKPVGQDESEMSIEIRLQRTLSQDVVEKLQQLAHVLSGT